MRVACRLEYPGDMVLPFILAGNVNSQAYQVQPLPRVIDIIAIKCTQNDYSPRGTSFPRSNLIISIKVSVESRASKPSETVMALQQIALLEAVIGWSDSS
jgi:hypothetical protein